MLSRCGWSNKYGTHCKTAEGNERTYKKECCNLDSGNCVLLDDGIYHKCTQLSQPILSCNWFREAFLPLDAVLEHELFTPGDNNIKKCLGCRRPFVPRANSSKYCDKCVPKVRRAKQAELLEKGELNSRQNEDFDMAAVAALRVRFCIGKVFVPKT